MTQPSDQEKSTGTSWALKIGLCCSWNKLLVRLASGELVSRLSLVSPKVFSPFCHRWSFGSLPLSPLAFLFGDTSFPAISSTLLHRYYFNWTELDDAINDINNINKGDLTWLDTFHLDSLVLTNHQQKLTIYQQRPTVSIKTNTRPIITSKTITNFVMVSIVFFTLHVIMPVKGTKGLVSCYTLRSYPCLIGYWPNISFKYPLNLFLSTFLL